MTAMETSIAYTSVGSALGALSYSNLYGDKTTGGGLFPIEGDGEGSAAGISLAGIFARQASLGDLLQVEGIFGANADRIMELRLRCVDTGYAGVSPDYACIHIDSSNYFDSLLICCKNNVMPKTTIDGLEPHKIQKQLQMLMPNLQANDANTLGGNLAYVTDIEEGYDALWLRLLAVGEAVARGWGLVAHPAVAHQEAVWPTLGANFGIAGGLVDVFGSIGRTGVQGTMLIASRAGQVLSHRGCEALWYAAQPHVNVAPLFGGQVPGVAGHLYENFPIFVLGAVTIRAPYPAAAPGNIAIADVWEAIRWVLSATGDISGFVRATCLFCSCIKFLGPEIEHLASMPATRFYGDTSGYLDVASILYYWSRSYITGVYDPALLVHVQNRAGAGAALGAAPAVGAVRPDTGSHELNAFTTLAAVCGNREVFLRSLTTREQTRLFANLVNWNWGGQAMGILAAPVAAPPGPALGAFDGRNLRAELSVRAAALPVSFTVACCSGIRQVIDSITVGGTIRGRSIVSPAPYLLPGMNNGDFLSRLYAVSACIRSAHDVVLGMTRLSHFNESAAMGLFDTGDAELDALLQNIGDLPAVMSQRQILQATYSLLAVYTSIGVDLGASDLTMLDVGTGIWPEMRANYTVPIAFHPALTNIILGGSFSTVGGAYCPNHDLIRNLLAKPGYPWVGNMDGINRLDVAGFVQFTHAVQGYFTQYANKIAWSDPEMGTSGTNYFDMPELAGARISENFPFMVRSVIPGIWFCGFTVKCNLVYRRVDRVFPASLVNILPVGRRYVAQRQPDTAVMLPLGNRAAPAAIRNSMSFVRAGQGYSILAFDPPLANQLETQAAIRVLSSRVTWPQTLQYCTTKISLLGTFRCKGVVSVSYDEAFIPESVVRSAWSTLGGVPSFPAIVSRIQSRSQLVSKESAASDAKGDPKQEAKGQNAGPGDASGFASGSGSNTAQGSEASKSGTKRSRGGMNKATQEKKVKADGPVGQPPQ